MDPIPREKKKLIWPLLITVYLAFIGISLPLPLLGPLLLKANTPFFPAGTLDSTKHFFWSLAVGLYPLGQFFGLPLWGHISDQFGRRTILKFCLRGTAIGYLGTGLAVYYENIPILLFSRFLTGLFEGNIALAQAMAADHFQGLHKARVFGFITSAISLGYTTGPLVSGVFLTFPTRSHLEYQLPFYFVGLISFLTSIFTQRRLPEDNPRTNFSERSSHSFLAKTKQNFSFFNITSYKNALYFGTIVTMGATLMIQFLSGYLLDFFQAPQKVISSFWIFFSVIWGSSAFLSQWGNSRIPHHFRSLVGFLLAGSMICLLPIIKNLWVFFLIFVPIVLFLSTGLINLSLFTSNSVPNNRQGAALGLRSSLRVLGDSLICFLGGILYSKSWHFPLIAAGMLCLFGGLFFYLFEERIPHKIVDWIKSDRRPPLELDSVNNKQDHS